MKYLTAFKAKAGGSVGFVGTFPHIHTENHDEENASKILNLPTLPYLSKIRSSRENYTYSYRESPTEPTKPGSVGFVGSKQSSPEHLASIAKGDRLRNESKAVPLCWLPPEQEKVALPDGPGKREDGRLWFE